MDFQRFKRRVRAIRDASTTLRDLPLSEVYEQAARHGGFDSWNAMAARFATLEESRAEAILAAIQQSAGMPDTGLKQQPIDKLPELLRQIEEQVEIYREQRRLLEKAGSMPHVMDDATLDRVIRLMEDQHPVREAIAAQISIWQTDKTIGDEKTLRQLSAAGKGNRFLMETAQDLLHKAREMKSHTIDRIMEMSDVELGLRFLGGELRLPGHEAQAQPEPMDANPEPTEWEEAFVRCADQTAKFLEQEQLDDEDFLDRMACHIPAMADLLELRPMKDSAKRWEHRYPGFGGFCGLLARSQERTNRPLPVFGMLYQLRMPQEVKHRYADLFRRSGEYEIALFTGTSDTKTERQLKKEARELTTWFRSSAIDPTMSRLLRVSLEFLEENREAARGHREWRANERFFAAVRDVKAELEKVVNKGNVEDREALKAVIKRAIDSDPSKPQRD